jgi:hypothetical protein
MYSPAWDVIAQHILQPDYRHKGFEDGGQKDQEVVKPSAFKRF